MIYHLVLYINAYNSGFSFAIFSISFKTFRKRFIFADIMFIVLFAEFNSYINDLFINTNLMFFIVSDRTTNMTVIRNIAPGFFIKLMSNF